MSQFQLLIFDWDGTLMDSAQKIANCIQAAARDLGLAEPTDKQAKHIIGLGLTEAMEILFPKLYGNQIARLLDAYRHHWLVADSTEQKLFEGVHDGLHRLDQEGVFLSIATGKSRAGLNRVFQELEVEHLFTCTRCADETRSKPHPQMLEEILEYTAIEPHKAIMIGDTTYDIDMAGNAKITGLGVGYGVHDEDALLASGAVSVVPDFAGLMDWLLDGRLEPAHES